MQFFRMRSPEYSSDAQDFHTNGNLEHIYRLPGLSCAACGATYGGSRILSDIAPPEIRDDRRFKSRWPVSDEEHAAMQLEVAGYLNKECDTFVTFKPGDNFQPAYLDIPSIPTSDFLWSNIRSFVISERMKRMVFDELAGDVEIVPVKLRKVGKQNVEQASPKLVSGEPKNVDSINFTDTVGTYYQVLVRSESGYPTGGEPISSCPVCKRTSIDEEKRELVMKESMWSGQQIFFLKTTLHIVVTETLAEKIRNAQASNVDFVPY